MKALLLAATLLALLPNLGRADEAPSVLVKTVPPVRGESPKLLIAHGTAAPATGGTMTLSLQLEGRVTAIAVTAGEAVRAGQTLLLFEASAASRSAYAQAAGALALARSQQMHVASLLTEKLATRDQAALADNAASDAQARLELLRQQGADRPTQTLSAPFDGVVAAIAVAPGDRLAAAAPLLTLTRADGLVVTAGIEPAARALVRPGQPVRLTPLAGGAVLDGQVLRIDAALNPRTRMVDADIAVPGSVLSGEAFRAVITIGRLQGWLVPHDAVLTDDDGARLFQIAAGKARRVAVTLLGTTGDIDVVDGPLDPTQKLVVQGNYQLTDGMSVRDETAP